MSNRLSPSPEELEEAVKIAAEGADVVAVYLFGSAARGRLVGGLSDVDLLAVTRGPPRYRAKTGRTSAGDANVVYMSADEVCEAYRRGDNLVREALEEGVLLAGEPVECAPGRHAGPPPSFARP